MRVGRERGGRGKERDVKASHRYCPNMSEIWLPRSHTPSKRPSAIVFVSHVGRGETALFFFHPPLLLLGLTQVISLAIRTRIPRRV
jgi:hypothetical protein